jgi:DNA-binding XRE family transcriptional regulator
VTELALAHVSQTDDRPANWHKWLLAAHLRRMGATQKQAAIGAGVARRTIHNWEAQSEMWADARRESLEMWGREMDDAARRRILCAIRDEGDTDSAWKYLERTAPALAPPTQRMKGEVDHRVQVFQLLETLPIEEIRTVKHMDDNQIEALLTDGSTDEG